MYAAAMGNTITAVFQCLSAPWAVHPEGRRQGVRQPVHEHVQLLHARTLLPDHAVPRTLQRGDQEHSAALPRKAGGHGVRQAGAHVHQGPRHAQRHPR